jgi:hypothetical protein
MTEHLRRACCRWARRRAFLTTSALLARRSPRVLRPALVARAELLPATTIEAKLLTLRRVGSHLLAPIASAPATVRLAA